MNMTIEQALQIGVEYRQAGRLAEAEAICRQVLNLHPYNAPALHLLGVLSGQAGRPDLAIELIDRAIDVAPGVADYHNDLAYSYMLLGRWDKAIVSLRRAIELNPGLTWALKNLGLCYHAQGRLDDAIKAYQRAMKLAREDPEIHNNLGKALAQQQGKSVSAIAAFRCALRLKPDYADAHNNLGQVLLTKGKFEEAIEAHQRAAEFGSHVAAYHNNLGNAWKNAGRLDEAVAAYQRAIAIDPGLPFVHVNLGVTFTQMGRVDEAIGAHRRAIQLMPEYPEAHFYLALALHQNRESAEAVECARRAIDLKTDDADACNFLGVMLQEAGQLDEAIGVLSQAISVEPQHAASHNNLGNALSEKGLIDEAVAALRRAIELAPRSPEAYSNLGKVLRDQGCLDDAVLQFRKAIAVRPDFSGAGSNLVQAVHYHPGYDAQAILAESRQWARQFAEPLATQIRCHSNDRRPDRKLRVGYISPDFRDNHPIGQLVLPLIAHHNRREFEVVCYSDLPAPDDFTKQLQASADAWHVTANVNAVQVAEQIREDRIDILVDLALHTANNRLLVFARKPAPVQVTMLGMPSTTGLSVMDYRLTDPYLDPSDTNDGDYSERSIRLPHCFWCYQPKAGTPSVGGLPALRNGFLTFGCLNQAAKLSRPALELWVRVLEAVPESRLVIQLQPGPQRDAVRAVFLDGGIAEDRIVFVPRVSSVQYLDRHNDLDLCLDPFPYNGHTTTLDALWMGVPVITLEGRTAVGRGGVSLLSNVGLLEFIAKTPEAYIEIAARWAGNKAGLASLRAGLRKRMKESALMDGQRYAMDVEVAFRRMWTTWCGT